MTIGKTASIALLLAATASAALAQANGDPGAASNGAARAETNEGKTNEDKTNHGASGGTAMQKGKSGNSGPPAGGMDGSNAMSGSGQKPGE